MRVPWGSGEWRRVAVYGLGRSGTAATRLLRRHGVEVIAFDARPAAELGLDRSVSAEQRDRPGGGDELGELVNDPLVELRLGGEPDDLPEAIDGIVVSPGVPNDRPLLVAARELGVPCIGEVELAFPFLDGPVVGVTGSNGKSTTVALTGALLEASGRAVETCGNIGRPLTSCVDGVPGRRFVVELSSFQLESIDTFRPDAAAVLNLSADHLDRHPDLAAYRGAKLRIFANQSGEDTAVVNADDPELARVATAARLRRFSTRGMVEDGCYLAGSRVVEVGEDAERSLFETGDVALAGRHNLENAMAAVLLALAVGGDPSSFASALRRFDGLPHRLEKVAEIDGVAYYDDSKATNVASVERALEGFEPGTVHLVLGGRGKGEDFARLRPSVARAVRRAYLIGEAADEIADAITGPDSSGRGELGTSGAVETVQAETMERAVELAAEAAAPGEAVLLSPACASYDQYRDFEERGDRFQRLVREREERGG